MNAPEFRLTREHSETVPTWRVWLDTGDAELCAGKAATACVEAFLGVTA
jgi:hypothetical protein